MRRSSRSRASPPEPNRSKRPRTLATRACDFCRERRRRCVFDDDDGPRCRDCSRLDLECAFLLPTQTRGPKRRQTLASSASGFAEHEHSPRPPEIEWLQPARGDVRLSVSHSSVSDGIRRNSITNGPWFATDKIGPRALILVIIDDYLARIYPLIPIIHRPTFRRQLDSGKDVDDPNFLSLILSLVVVTVGLLPSRFPYYRSMIPSNDPLTFETREVVMNSCIDMCMCMRTATYWDQISHQKFAVSYLLSVGCFQLGQTNRSRMLEVEFLQTGRLLGIHRIADYEGLNCIETQLRKKSFWLCFYTYAHGWYQCGRQERLGFFDHGMLGEVNFEALFPLELDDEKILEDKILESPISPPAAASPMAPSTHQHSQAAIANFNLVGGFNLHSRVFYKSAQLALAPATCDWARGLKPEDMLVQLRQLLQEIRYMLDDVPYPLRQWASPSWYEVPPPPSPLDNIPAATPGSVRQNSCSGPNSQPRNVDDRDLETLPGQFEIMRANLHGTHLWLQSSLLDRIDLILQEMSKRPDIWPSERNLHLAALKASWSEREDICRQLLHLLHSIPHSYMEPNGLYFAYKVRDVGAALLNCPYEPHEPPARRATEYMHDFTRALSRLDRSERMNTSSLKSWIDTDREKAAN